MPESGREHQLGFMEIPEVLRPIIKVLERLDKIKEEERLRGRRLTGRKLLSNAIENQLIGSSPRYPSSIGGVPINVIPSYTMGPCAEILLVFIGEMDGFEHRILEAIEHCGVLCRGVTKYVVFYAIRWDDAVWKRHERSFKMINAIVVLKPFGRPPTRIS